MEIRVRALAEDADLAPLTCQPSLGPSCGSCWQLEAVGLLARVYVSLVSVD